MKTVERGAELLDAVRPGWEHEIDADKLDLRSRCNCVLGQLYLQDHPRTHNRADAFNRMLEELGIETPGKFGFATYGAGRYSRLTEAWLGVIRRRLG